MKPRKSIYLAHRWLGLVVCLQLLAWSVGGLVFSLLDIDRVRGTTNSSGPLLEPLAPSAQLISPAKALTASGLADTPIASIALVDRGLGPSYELRDAEGTILMRVNAATASPHPLLTPDQAKAQARADFIHDAPVTTVELIESAPPSELRGKPLPAYRVTLDHPSSPHIYVDAVSGQILARRNNAWRAFDFFWMLHIMDYNERENFNHPLLTAFSLLAILTASTGASLWIWRALQRSGRPKRPRTTPVSPAPTAD